MQDDEIPIPPLRFKTGELVNDNETQTVPVTSDGLLDLVDLLEAIAVRIEAIDSGLAEKYTARRLMIDAAAHVRGAARQMHKLETR